jgi:signal peptidase I
MQRPTTGRQLRRRLLAAVSALLIFLAVAAIATGQIGYVVTSGISMEPLYHTGDLVVIERASSYHVGEIVAYHGPLDGHLVVLHRIVGGNAISGFVMKGDNNHFDDPIHPVASQVIGRAVLHIPKVGLVLTSPIVRGLLILVVVVLLASLVFAPRRRSAIAPPGLSSPSPGKPAVTPFLGPPPPGSGLSTVAPLFRSRPASGPTAASPLLRSREAGSGRTIVSPLFRPSEAASGRTAAGTLVRPPMSATAVAYRAERPGTLDLSRAAEVVTDGNSPRGPIAWKILLGAVVLVALALVLSFVLIGPSRPEARPVPFTQTAALGYQAKVPKSATYPTGRVSTGRPVFLRLVDRLVVSFTDSSDAPASSVRGTAHLDAVLSSASGWDTTFRLVKPTPLSAGRVRLSATLDLAQLQAMANRVSAATSVYTGTLSLTVTGVYSVSFDGGKPVTNIVELPLSLSALELTLSGGNVKQTAGGPAVVSTNALNTVPPPPTPSSLPHEVRLGMLVALLLLIAITFLAIPESEPDGGRGPYQDR